MLRVVYFVTWPIAALILLVATRKLRGLGWWILNAVGMYGTVLAVFILFYFFLSMIGREDLVDPSLFE